MTALTEELQKASDMARLSPALYLRAKVRIEALEATVGVLMAAWPDDDERFDSAMDTLAALLEGDEKMPERYPEEVLGEDDDDGTMPDNVEALAEAVVGRRIVEANKGDGGMVLTLDNGRQVILQDTDDCCAYTELEEFWLDPTAVDHMILGVGTTDDYTTWHIFADFGDIMRLKVGWSCGNPFYYGYGFDIRVK